MITAGEAGRRGGGVAIAISDVQEDQAQARSGIATRSNRGSAVAVKASMRLYHRRIL